RKIVAPSRLRPSRKPWHQKFYTGGSALHDGRIRGYRDAAGFQSGRPAAQPSFLSFPITPVPACVETLSTRIGTKAGRQVGIVSADLRAETARMRLSYGASSGIPIDQRTQSPSLWASCAILNEHPRNSVHTSAPARRAPTAGTKMFGHPGN